MWPVTVTDRGTARAYGSGSLWVRRNARGGETWYGQVRVDGRVVRRALGPKRGVEQFMAQKLDDGKAPKSVTNWLGILHSLFEFAIRRGWAEANPCKRVAKP